MKLVQKNNFSTNKSDLKNSDIESLGAEFYNHLKTFKQSEYYVFSDSLVNKNKNFLGYFLHGVKLKSYQFVKYKSKQDKKKFILNIIGTKNKPH